MDMIVRFWGSKTNKVTERCVNSEFMGHATATDMLTHFKHGIALLNPYNSLQIFMDDPK